MHQTATGSNCMRDIARHAIRDDSDATL